MSGPVRRFDPEYPSLLPAVLRAAWDTDPIRRTTRDWVVDVLVVTVAGLISFAAFVSSYHLSAPSRWTTLDLIVGILMWCSLWFRRRWPVALAIAGTVAGTVAVASAGPGLALVFTVAVHRRYPALALVCGLTIASFVPYYLLHPDKGMPYWVSVLLSLALLGITVAWGMVVRARRQLVLSLRERAVRAESEQALRVEQAQRRERERIAREMHDVLAHRISLLSLHAGALEFRPDATPEEIAQAAGVIRSNAHQALEELREVITVLREDPSDDAPRQPQPTLADLTSLVEESRAAGTKVDLRGEVDAAAIPGSTGRTAYRIVQEGLTNARKHAFGTTVRVTVDGTPADGLTVAVLNPLPVGGNRSRIPGAGSGLIGLAERVGLAGGRLEHGTTPAGYFRLDAWLPWLPATAAKKKEENA